VKETGIIMSGDHPKLILDGIKTQTRRVIKPQPSQTGNIFVDKIDREILTMVECCPYGQVGDRLWVRETHQYLNVASTASEHDFGVKYKADGEIKWWRDNAGIMDYPINEKIRPSIHLKEMFVRIWLEITEVRVERVQEISDVDVQAEGCQYPQWLGSHTSWQGAYKALWDSLDAKRKPTKFDREQGITEPITPSYAWVSNPWVWVISFKGVE